MIKAIPQTLRQIGWNRRPLSLDDFYEACERARITVIEDAIDDFGYYFELHGQRAIALDKRLAPLDRAHVAFHEFAHAAWHAPGHYVDSHIVDAQADIIAHCALLPRPWLYRFTVNELMATPHDYPRWLIERRIETFRNFRL
jgi:Zn-dependent peptidase ImmA (M78 family)